MTDDLDNLHDLPPEERIKKLKELEKKRKKEIEDARKKIKESEDELTERMKWLDKVPIPELAKEDLEGLSEEAKIALKTIKGVKEKDESVTDEDEDIAEIGKTSKDKGQGSSLEDVVGKGKTKLPAQAGIEYGLDSGRQLMMPNEESAMGLSYSPVDDLQNQMNSLYDTVKSKGYMTWEEQQQAVNVNNAIDEKFKAYDSGKYSLSEAAATAAIMTKKVTGRLLDQHYTATKADLKDWYKG